MVTNKEVLAYDPKEGRWDMVGDRMGGCMFSDAYCVIENVWYSASNGVFKWYDTQKRRRWRGLRGLVGLPKITRDRGFIRLGDHGVSYPSHYKEIWCAEIALERRRDTSEIWGKVDWFDELLKIDTLFQVEKVLSTTV